VHNRQDKNMTDIVVCEVIASVMDLPPAHKEERRSASSASACAAQTSLAEHCAVHLNAADRFQAAKLISRRSGVAHPSMSASISSATTTGCVSALAVARAVAGD